MTAARFRKLALSLEGVEERSHMNHPDFRVGGRIFATLGYPTAGHGCVKLTPEQLEAAVEAAPDVFQPAAGAWGKAGNAIVTLKAADQETVGATITQAWQNATAKKPAKARTRKA